MPHGGFRLYAGRRMGPHDRAVIRTDLRRHRFSGRLGKAEKKAESGLERQSEIPAAAGGRAGVPAADAGAGLLYAPSLHSVLERDGGDGPLALLRLCRVHHRGHGQCRQPHGRGGRPGRWNLHAGAFFLRHGDLPVGHAVPGAGHLCLRPAGRPAGLSGV